MAKEKLTEYSAKRSFTATPEPAPSAAAARKGPLLFVIQQHSARRMHWDCWAGPPGGCNTGAVDAVAGFRVGEVELTRVPYFDVALDAAVVSLTAEQIRSLDWATPSWATPDGCRENIA